MFVIMQLIPATYLLPNFEIIIELNQIPAELSRIGIQKLLSSVGQVATVLDLHFKT